MLGYPMSYLEFLSVVSGAVAVWLSARANVWSWPVGLIAGGALAAIILQIQLYPDVFLQVFSSSPTSWAGGPGRTRPPAEGIATGTGNKLKITRTPPARAAGLER